MTGTNADESGHSSREQKPDGGLDTWTRTHDLALILIALAYGTDRRLVETELEAIIDAIAGWRPGKNRDEAMEIVMETVAVYLESDVETEIVNSINTLRQVLTPEQRKRALDDAANVAQADGVYLGSERSLVSVLAAAWEIKQMPLEDGDEEDWTVMHDLGLIYVALAHGADADLSEPEIAAILERLGQWQPEMTEKEVRSVLREVLAFYATQPEEKDFGRSVTAIRMSFPIPQRLAVLDDLLYVARSDGEVTEHERAMIATLSHSWGVGVRLNGVV